MYPEEAKVTEKGLIHKQKYVTVPAEMWEAKHISANEKSYLQKANEALESNLQEFRSTTSSKNLGMMQRPGSGTGERKLLPAGETEVCRAG